MGYWCNETVRKGSTWRKSFPTDTQSDKTPSRSDGGTNTCLRGERQETILSRIFLAKKGEISWTSISEDKVSESQ